MSTQYKSTKDTCTSNGSVLSMVGIGSDLLFISGSGAIYWSSKNSPTRDFMRPASSFRVSQISSADVRAVEPVFWSSSISNASRAVDQVGRFTVDGVDVVLEGSGIRVLVLRLLLLVSVVWQE